MESINHASNSTSLMQQNKHTDMYPLMELVSTGDYRGNGFDTVFVEGQFEIFDNSNASVCVYLGITNYELIIGSRRHHGFDDNTQASDVDLVKALPLRFIRMDIADYSTKIISLETCSGTTKYFKLCNVLPGDWNYWVHVIKRYRHAFMDNQDIERACEGYYQNHFISKYAENSDPDDESEPAKSIPIGEATSNYHHSYCGTDVEYFGIDISSIIYCTLFHESSSSALTNVTKSSSLIDTERTINDHGIAFRSESCVNILDRDVGISSCLNNELTSMLLNEECNKGKMKDPTSSEHPECARIAQMMKKIRKESFCIKKENVETKIVIRSVESSSSEESISEVVSKCKDQQAKMTGKEGWGKARTRVKATKKMTFASAVEELVFEKCKAKPSLFEFSADEIGRELTLMVRILLMKVTPSSLRGTMKNLKGACGLSSLRQFSDHISRLMAMKVLSQPTAHQRADMMVHILQVAGKCWELRNFDTAAAILTGLHLMPILRLTRTMNKLKTRHTEAYRKYLSMCKKFSRVDGFGKYSSALSTAMATPPYFPWIDHFLYHTTSGKHSTSNRQINERRHVHKSLSRKLSTTFSGLLKHSKLSLHKSRTNPSASMKKADKTKRSKSHKDKPFLSRTNIDPNCKHQIPACDRSEREPQNLRNRPSIEKRQNALNVQSTNNISATHPETATRRQAHNMYSKMESSGSDDDTGNSDTISNTVIERYADVMSQLVLTNAFKSIQSRKQHEIETLQESDNSSETEGPDSEVDDIDMEAFRELNRQYPTSALLSQSLDVDDDIRYFAFATRMSAGYGSSSDSYDESDMDTSNEVIGGPSTPESEYTRRRSLFHESLVQERSHDEDIIPRHLLTEYDKRRKPSVFASIYDEADDHFMRENPERDLASTGVKPRSRKSGNSQYSRKKSLFEAAIEDRRDSNEDVFEVAIQKRMSMKPSETMFSEIIVDEPEINTSEVTGPLVGETKPNVEKKKSLLSSFLKFSTNNEEHSDSLTDDDIVGTNSTPVTQNRKRRDTIYPRPKHVNQNRRKSLFDEYRNGIALSSDTTIDTKPAQTRKKSIFDRFIEDTFSHQDKSATKLQKTDSNVKSTKIATKSRKHVTFRNADNRQRDSNNSASYKREQRGTSQSYTSECICGANKCCYNCHPCITLLKFQIDSMEYDFSSIPRLRSSLLAEKVAGHYKLLQMSLCRE